MSVIATFVLMVAVGLVVGIISGLVGVGGGTFMIPLFRLVFGFSPIVSTATSLFTIIPTSAAGVVGHVRNRTCIPRLGVVMGFGGACTSPIGVWLAHISPGWLIMVASALAIGYSAINMFHKALEAVPSTASPVPSQPALAARDFALGAIIGAIAGLFSGYIGLGGGFLMVPLMLTLLALPMKLASGTSLMAIMILAVPGVVAQGMIGNIELLAGVAMACGTIPGALIGARLLAVVPERGLRFAFAALLAVAAVLLVLKEVGLLG